MRFGAAVGNPPYQRTSRDTSDDPVYPGFVEMGHRVADVACFVTPARFLFDAGKTSKSWNKRLLEDPHLKVAALAPRSGDVFRSVRVTGGVAVTIRSRKRDWGPIGSFVALPLLASAVEKTRSAPDFEPWTRDLHKQLHFDLDELYERHPALRSIVSKQGKETRLTTSILARVPLFAERPAEADEVRVLGIIDKKRLYRHIPGRYLKEHANLGRHKVIVPKSNGAGAIGEILDVPVIGEPLLGPPGTGHTQSFISFGRYPDEATARRALAYVKSKFCRALLGSLKITQDNNPATWANVPAQDFSPRSDVDWSLPGPEVDRQLYRKYDLDRAEIDFIEKAVRAMP